ncbi:hypothetical protein ACFL47_10005 [Candidatus Latescibacterota bacterium]
MLKRLEQEAQGFGEGSTPSARVQALGLLGKHLSMFTQKIKSDSVLTVNVVNRYERAVGSGK